LAYCSGVSQEISAISLYLNDPFHPHSTSLLSWVDGSIHSSLMPKFSIYMSERIATMHEESAGTLSSDAGPLFRAFPSLKGLLKSGPEQMVAGLYASLRSKARILSVEDLENSLFLLNKDLRKLQSSRRLSLEPLIAVHPLFSLRQGSLSPKSAALVDLRLSRLIREQPGTVHQYQWTLKAMDYIADLSLFWGLISPDNFAYREVAAESLVLCM